MYININKQDVKTIFTYIGSQYLGIVIIIVIAIPVTAIIQAPKKKNENFLINGQFQYTKLGVSFVICIFKISNCLELSAF